jgi:hypothetical protein
MGSHASHPTPTCTLHQGLAVLSEVFDVEQHIHDALHNSASADVTRAGRGRVVPAPTDSVESTDSKCTQGGTRPRRGHGRGRGSHNRVRRVEDEESSIAPGGIRQSRARQYRGCGACCQDNRAVRGGHHDGHHGRHGDGHHGHGVLTMWLLPVNPQSFGEVSEMDCRLGRLVYMA